MKNNAEAVIVAPSALITSFQVFFQWVNVNIYFLICIVAGVELLTMYAYKYFK